MKELLKKCKGTVSHFNDDSLEFTPYGKGEPVYEASYKVGAATLGITKSKANANSNYVAKLKAAADSADPIEDMHAQLDKLKLLKTLR